MYKKTASDALQEYIDHFEGRPRSSRHYTGRLSDLLSPKRELLFSDKGKRDLSEEMSSDGEGLLSWINKTYKESLKSTCAPLYAHQAGKHENSPADASYSKYKRAPQLFTDQLSDDLSTLPSPSITDADIDSDQDTVETDVLVQSYHNRSKGSSWDKKKGLENHSLSSSKYPKWVDDVDRSIVDETDPRRLSSVSVLLKSNHSKASLSQSKSMDVSGLTMDDTSSIDTDVILDASVYGKPPVNMGGNLHTSRFRDERLQAMLKESRTKLKRNPNSSQSWFANRNNSLASSRLEITGISPQRKDVIYSEQILNKYRSSYDDTDKNAKDKSIAHRAVSTASRRSAETSKLRSSIGTQSIRQISPLSAKNSFSGKLSTSDLGDEIRVPSCASKKSDVYDVHSQKTSGYHSEILSPNRLHMGRSFEYNPKLVRGPIQDSFLRRDSNDTDVLMRQPPIGSKVHQRSKTWDHSRPFVSSSPKLASSPTRQSTIKPSSVSISYSPQHNSYTALFPQNDIVRRTRMPESTTIYGPNSTFTDWKSSALQSRQDHLATRAEEVKDNESFLVTEHVQNRYVADEATFRHDSGVSGNDIFVESLEDDDFAEHNKTWPSIERLKQRSKMAYLRSRTNEAKSFHGGWTSKKRSIPLRIQSASSGARTSSMVSPNRTSSSRETLGHYIVKDIDSQARPSFHERATAIEALTNSQLKSRQISHNDDDDDDDDVTINTELLLSQPPMPIVDASPSLSTVSDSDTNVEDDSDNETQSFVDLPFRSSSRVSFAPNVSFSHSNMTSPSKSESKNGSDKKSERLSQNQAVRALNTSSQPFMHRAEFVDSNGNIETYKRDSAAFPESTGRNVTREEPRTVEVLKNMLLNLNGVGPVEDKNVENYDYEESTNTDDEATNVIGDQSLERAYHHLERLKNLISGRVDS